MVSTTRPDVLLSLDVGTSGNKIFWQLWSSEKSSAPVHSTQLMLMPPELLAY